jgi:hypothetical protein
MKLLTLTIGLLAVTLTGPAVLAQVPPLTDSQLDEAIALGKTGDVPIALVGRMLGISKGDFDVFVEGPMGRIAAAAEHATKQLRPFSRADVTTEMKEPVYRVVVRRTEHASRYPMPKHIVMMPRKTKDLNQAIQPVREPGRMEVWEAFFDRLPEGESTS